MADLPTVGTFYQPSLMRHKAIKAKSKVRSSAKGSGYQTGINTIRHGAVGHDVRRSLKNEADGTYVTEVCLGPPSRGSHSTEEEHNDCMEHAWQEYLDCRGEVFYMELSASHEPQNSYTANTPAVESRTRASRATPDVLWQQSQQKNTRDREKDVYVSVAPSKTHPGDVAGVCEALFGVILCRYHSRPGGGGERAKTKERMLVVQGVRTGSDADRCQQIHRGDTILKIDDESVMWSNVEAVLARFTKPKMVKMTLQPPLVIGSTPESKPIPPACALPHSLQYALLGETRPSDSLAFVNHPHTTMYLTLDSNDDSPGDHDIIYQFPDFPSKLTELRGAFLTVANVFREITHNSTRISTLEWENHLVHVAYYRDGRNTFVLALPAKFVTRCQLSHVLQDLVRILRVSYGSVSSAFRHTGNFGQLDQLFCFTFHHILETHELNVPGLSSPDDYHSRAFLDCLGASNTLHTHNDYQVYCDSLLSDFDAADFTENDDEILDMRRTYTVLGTVLFYKGMLVCSHVDPDDQHDLYLLLKYLCVTAVTRVTPVVECVMWHETFPTRHSRPHPDTFGYTEPHARYFTLVVAQKHTMVGVLLEAGGCAAWAEGNPPPSPFYVDRVKSLISEIEASGMTVCFDKLLTGMSSGPSLVGADRFIAVSGRSRDEIIHTPPSPTKLQSPTNKMSTFDSSQNQFWQPSPKSEKKRITFGDNEIDANLGEPVTPASHHKHARRPSNESYESCDSGASAHHCHFNTNKASWYSSVFDLTNLNRGLSIRDTNSRLPRTRRVTRGASNVLFHYVTCDLGAAVYVCPTAHEVAGISGVIHIQVLTNFYHCCHILHSRFERSQPHTVKHDETARFKSFLDSVKCSEEAVMFQFTPSTWTDLKKAPPQLAYWVIGRRVSGRDVYVCVQESVPQNLLELAFFLCQYPPL